MHACLPNVAKFSGHWSLAGAWGGSKELSLEVKDVVGKVEKQNSEAFLSYLRHSWWPINNKHRWSTEWKEYVGVTSLKANEDKSSIEGLSKCDFEEKLSLSVCSWFLSSIVQRWHCQSYFFLFRNSQIKGKLCQIPIQSFSRWLISNEILNFLLFVLLLLYY